MTGAPSTVHPPSTGQGPIDQRPIGPQTTDWTRRREEDSTKVGAVPLRAFAAALGGRDVVALASWSAAINTVAADFAEAVDAPWPHDTDTAVVVLLRAIGLLAQRHPDATSPLGAALLVLLDAADVG